ncbi:mechanosensitive ion channel domain-containing protein [uncultured Desulfosarcina sp.]|uniref:mechanosensitive ion channel family protein n=1 Tax=uncultured Desulfosarcina sp. TaxID=218289 RepID=UPI0029C69AB7|nr:mechanosensitive ion channel domain-containing protein [uncultured Desulfosarcina sp.]
MSFPRFATLRPLFLWFSIGFLLFGFSASGFCAETQASPDEETQTAPPPSLADVVHRAGALEQRLTSLKAKIETVNGLPELKQRLEKARTRVDGFETRLAAVDSEGLQSYQQLAILKGDVRAEAELVAQAVDVQTAAIRQIEAWRRQWMEEKTQWQIWREVLHPDLALDSVAEAFNRAETNIDQAEMLITRKLGPMLAVQQQAGDIQARIDSLLERIDAMVAQRRGNNLRSDTPTIVSIDYIRQLIDLVHEPKKLIQSPPLPAMDFYSEKGWLIGMQALVFVVILSLLRRHRSTLQGRVGRRFLAKRPVSVALLVPIFTLSFLYGSPPALWSMLIRAVAGVATARLLTHFTGEAWIKRAVYILVAVMVVFQVLTILDVPLALVRLFILVATVTGTIYYGWRARKARIAASPAWHVWVLRLVTLVFAAITVADMIGLGGFSAQLMDGALRTAMLLIMGWAMIRLTRTLLELAAEWIPMGGFSFLRSNANAILARIIRIANGLIFFFVAANLLVAWNLYALPVDAIHDILAFGVNVGGKQITIGLVLVAGIILYGAFVSSWILQSILMENLLNRGQMDSGARLSVVRLVHYAMVLVGFLIALSTMGFELKNITIIGGALGVGIGFGMQAIVNNFVSGLILLFERPIKVGDVIQLGDGQQGRVTNLGLRATTVQTFDKAEVVVPNGDLIASQVTNWTLGDRNMRLIIPVGVAYGSDVEAVMRVLMAVATESDKVLKEPQPMVLFLNFGDSSLDFQLRVWIADFNDRRIIQSALIREIDRRFREEGIEIPFPQRDLHLRSVDSSAAGELKGG